MAEQIKEGYESDVEPPEPEEEEPYNPEMDDDGDFTPSKSFLTRAKQKQNAIKSTRSNNQEEDSQERQVINFNPNADMNEDSVREKYVSLLKSHAYILFNYKFTFLVQYANFMVKMKPATLWMQKFLEI